jgi:hypothetical protein
MPERRTSERRKKPRDFRVDVTRLEHEQLKALMIDLADRVAQLERNVEELRQNIDKKG